MVTYLLPLALQRMQLIRKTLITSRPILPDSLIPVLSLESPWGEEKSLPKSSTGCLDDKYLFISYI